MIKKSEDWLVSYGDCITLLICLLITIVVSLRGQSEKDIEWVADQVKSITEMIDESYPDTNIFKIYPRASSFKVTLAGNNFKSCKDELNSDVVPIIKDLGIDLLKSLKKLDQMEKPVFITDSLYLEISVEGHTDSQLLPPNCGGFENNWQLSASRAYETMQVLTNGNNLPQELLPYKNSISVRGYADSHPVCMKEEKVKKRLEEAIANNDEIAIKKARQKLAIKSSFTDCYEINRRTEIIFTAFLMGSRGTYYSDAGSN